MKLRLFPLIKSSASFVFHFLLLVCTNTDAQVLWEPVNIPGRVPVWQIARSENAYLLKSETGIYRSIDEGKTWEFCAQTAPTDGYLVSIDDAMLIHANPGNGLFVSSDAGVSWQMIWYGVPAASTGLAASETHIFYATVNGIYRYPKSGGPPSTVLQFPLYQQFANVKVSGNNIWASSNSKLFRSADNGGNWLEIAALSNFRCFQPHGDTVLVALQNALIRTDNNGQDWTTIDNFSGAMQQLYWQDGCWLALTTETPVLWSGDGGQTWSPPATGPFPNYNVTGVVKNGPLWLVASHLGGVFRSPNNGEYWIVNTTGLQSTPVYPPEWLDCTGDFLMYNIGFTHLSYGEDNTWFMPLPTSAYDPFLRVVQHKDSYFALSLWGSIFQQESGNPYGWVKRSSGYQYNSTFGYGLSTQLHDLGDRMAVTETYADPDAVYQSTNGGLSWPEVGELPLGAYSMEAFSKRLYCLTDGYNCLSSSDVGASWIFAGEGLPALWSDAARLCARSGGLLFIDEKQMYIRTETEQSFFHIPMPNEAISRVWDADVHDGQLVVATDAGIFITTDWGNTWTTITAELPEQDFSNAHIRFHQGFVYLLLPDFPEPLWRYELPLTNIAETLQENGVILFPNPLPEGATVRIKPACALIQEKESVDVQVFDCQGKNVVSMFLQTAGYSDEISLGRVALFRGVYYVRVRAGNKMASCKLVKI